MMEKMKRKVSCLLVVIMVTTALLSGSGATIVRAEGEQGNPGTVSVNDQPEQAGEVLAEERTAGEMAGKDTASNIPVGETDTSDDLAEETGATDGVAGDSDTSDNPGGDSAAERVPGSENQEDAAAQDNEKNTADGEMGDDQPDGPEEDGSGSETEVRKTAARSGTEDAYCTIYVTGDTLNGWLSNGYDIKLNIKMQSDAENWEQLSMTDSGKTISGKKVYLAELTQKQIPFGGLAVLQFQAYAGNIYQEQREIFSTWTGAEVFGNKVFDLNSWQWIDPNFDIYSYAGRTVYFMNMDLNASLTDLKAQFCVAGTETASSMISMTSAGTGGLYQVTVPECEGDIYDTVVFYQGGTKLSEERLIQGDYDPDSASTFYYHITKKSDGTYVNRWAEKPEAAASICNKTLYLDKIAFPVSSEAVIRVGTGSQETLEKDSDDQNTYSYTISDGAATQQTVLTVKAGGAEYHFLWSDLAGNLLTVDGDIATVSGTYAKSNTVYYDASMSKLSYAGSAVNNILPLEGKNIYFHAWNSPTECQDGEMILTPSHSSGGNTWSDVYKADLDKEYQNIIFYSSDGLGIYPADTSSSKTVDLVIPWNETAAPCFYGDTSDSAVYDGARRDGYWDDVYTIRDAEKGKSTDVVNITQAAFKKESDTLYVNSTFYDYYSDYELNGFNRDDYNYGGDNAMSQRNWVNFRQFNQALSDIYKANGVAIPIYTGHFQPDWYDSNGVWGNPFSAIADTLALYGYDKNNQSSFMSTNNSTMDINYGGGKYDYAAWGLVSNRLSGGNLMTSDGKIAEPHFDESFLSGNNSKNAVLGDVYHNVAFPFTKKDINNDGVEYWYFDSAETTLAMRQDSSTCAYYLQNVGNQGWSMNVNSTSQTGSGNVSNTYGFFPFNENTAAASAKNYNYGFGTKLEFKFRLTEDGTVLNNKDEAVPITFQFSGDDDVWVFIDGQLALDVGGAHGRVEGTLDFASKKATVSHVKASAGDSTSGSNVTKEFIMQGSNTDEHTLTMFYMERGMWESNMKIDFNFPDENELEVEKQIDKTDVNDLFKDVFDNQSLFSFEIKNLATHFGTKEVDSNGDEITVKNVDLSACTYTPAAGNTCELIQKDGTDCVHWYAGMEDKTGGYRDQRYGTIDLGSGIDLSGMSYLQFEYYYDYYDTPSLSNMYLQLVDEAGRVKGNITDYLSGKTYGAVTMAGKTWVTVRIDLGKLFEEKAFDGTVTKIRFGYNYPRNIYLRNISFYPETTVSSLTGFVTKQYAIPDYGSAVSGQLEVPVGAKYSSSTGKNYVIRQDGMFVLANGERAVFRDQFRRGSYISLREITSSELFDTSWTLYEDGREVTSMGTGQTVTNGSVSSLSNVKSMAVNDGRTENVSNDYEDGQAMKNVYNGVKPSQDTFVFRSYDDPDATTGTTKLKVVFTNKVKTGSLTIKKEKTYETDTLDSTYRFHLTFSNVGSLGLESEPIEYPVIELKVGEEYTITGIPLGTLYHLTEEQPEDGSSLEEVLVDGKNSMDPETKGITGIVDSEHTSVTAVFKNTKKPMVNITLFKMWKTETGEDLTEDIPASIRIQLQRREKGSNSPYIPVADFDENYDQELQGIVWTPGYEGWTYTAYGLDKLADYTDPSSPEYEYRFVELDSDGNVLEDGSVMDGYIVSYEEVEKDEETGDFVAGITNTLEPPKVAPLNLKIIKKDAENSDLLSGVEFKLERLQETNGSYAEMDDTFEAMTGITGDGDGTKGQVEFAELSEGHYRLTETKAADGYSLLKDPITIVLDRQNGCTVDGQKYEPDENNTITITIQNRKKFSFPFTGGYGTTYMILGGFALAGAALFMYRLQIRKKGGRKSLKRL